VETNPLLLGLLIGLLYQPRMMMMMMMMMMIMKQSVELLVGETKVFGESLPRCPFSHHKSHMI
jgi:hypothetical protein